MEISRTTAAAVGALCVALGAGGAYLATRDGAPAARGTVVTASPADEPSGELSDESAPAATDARETAWQPEIAPAPAPRRSPAAVVRRAADPVTAVLPPSESAAPQTFEPETAPAPPETAHLEPAPQPPADASAPGFEELVVEADTVIGLQVDSSLSSEQARVEDPVVAHVTRDVRVGDRVAIPTGARATGTVTLVERGGRVRERARLGLRFTAIELADGTRIAIDTDTIYRNGDPPGRGAAARVGGGAVVGAIIGGILGGTKGAVLGGSAGAGAGTATVLAGGRSAATLPSGTSVTVRLLSPATVTVEQ